MQIDADEQPTPRSAEWLAGWDAGRAQEFKLASVVTRQRSEIDTLRATLTEAERAQMERDCAAVCYKCAEPMKGLLPAALWDGVWRHPVSGDDASLSCHANHIRRAFAALHPESEGKKP